MQRLGRRQKSLELVNRRYIKTLQNVWNTSIRLWPLVPGLSWTLINQNAISEAVLPPKKNTSTGFRYAVKKNKVGTSLSYFFSFSCFSNSCNSFCFCSCKNNFPPLNIPIIGQSPGAVHKISFLLSPRFKLKLSLPHPPILWWTDSFYFFKSSGKII